MYIHKELSRAANASRAGDSDTIHNILDWICDLSIPEDEREAYINVLEHLVDTCGD